MITSVKFMANAHGALKKGKEYAIRQLTLLVGDNGTGKTTFIESVVDAIKAAGKGENSIAAIRMDEHEMSGYRCVDFESDNPRMKSDSIFDVASRWRSHGETNMDILINGLLAEKDTLILLDEPDQALSIRSCARLYRAFEKSVNENGNQIIASVHSQTMMELAGQVLSLEHGRWVSARAFIRSQAFERPLRTVDTEGSKTSYKIRITLDRERMEKELSICGMPDYDGYLVNRYRQWTIERRHSDGKRFATKEAAQKVIDRIKSKKHLLFTSVWGRNDDERNAFKYITGIEIQEFKEWI